MAEGQAKRPYGASFAVDSCPSALLCGCLGVRAALLGTALGQLLQTCTPHRAEPPSPKQTLLLKSYCWQCPHPGDPHPPPPSSPPLTGSDIIRNEMKS